MEKYEYPLGVTFKASTPEHAAARVFGGKPADYLAVRKTSAHVGMVSGLPYTFRYVEVTSADGSEWFGEIPLV